MKKEFLIDVIKSGYIGGKEYNRSITNFIEELRNEHNFELARIIENIQNDNYKVIKADKKNDFKKQISNFSFPRKILDEMSNIEIGYKKDLIKHILLAGNPGTGKTSFINLLSTKLKLKLISIKLSDIMDYKYGESIKNLESIMQIYSNEKCLIFFDEADSLFGKRFFKNDISETNRILTTMLKILDLNNKSLICFATNLYQYLDKAFIRRMDCVINFNCYSNNEYQDIINTYSNIYDLNLLEDEKKLILDNIDNMSNIFSPSYLQILCKKIAINLISKKYSNIEVINNFFNEVNPNE